jgi:hypothetical protein
MLSTRCIGYLNLYLVYRSIRRPHKRKLGVLAGEFDGVKTHLDEQRT